MSTMRYIAVMLVVGATVALAQAQVMVGAPRMHHMQSQPIAALQTEPRFRIWPGGNIQALEGDAAPTPVPQPKAAVEGEQKCEKDFEYSKIFKKCLPIAGKDGYVPAKSGAAEAPKGKLLGESNVITAETLQPSMLHEPQMLRTAPLHIQPLVGHAANQPTQQPTQPPAQQPTQPTPTPRQPLAGQSQQLRLACPPGFTYQPNIGSCVGLRPTGALSEARGNLSDDNDDDDDGNRDRERDRDSDDGSDDDQARGPATSQDRRSQLSGRPLSDGGEREISRFRRYRRFARHHPFMFAGGMRGMHGMRGMRGRYLGTYRGEQPSILAPVFVFVLPPMRMGGAGKQRVHEIHPSFVGPARPANATIATKGTEPTTEPAREAKGTPPVPKPAPETTTPARDATPATPVRDATPATPVTPATRDPRSALHKAEFISPLITGAGDNIAAAKGGSTDEPAKLSESPRVDALTEDNTAQPLVDEQSHVQPLRVDSGVSPSLMNRAGFISPLVTEPSAIHSAAGDDTKHVQATDNVSAM